MYAWESWALDLLAQEVLSFLILDIFLLKY